MPLPVACTAFRHCWLLQHSMLQRRIATKVCRALLIKGLLCQLFMHSHMGHHQKSRETGERMQPCLCSRRAH